MDRVSWHYDFATLEEFNFRASRHSTAAHLSGHFLFGGVKIG